MDDTLSPTYEALLVFSKTMTSLDWIILTGIAVLFVGITVWNIVHKPYSVGRILVVLLLRFFLLGLIYLYFLDPQVVERERVPAKMEIPFFIDHSYSMNNNTDVDSTSFQSFWVSWLHGLQANQSNWNSNWQIHSYLFNAMSIPYQLDTPAPLPDGIFKWDSFQETINSRLFDYPAAILLSDLCFPMPDLSEPLHTPVFLINPEVELHDLWVEDPDAIDDTRTVTLRSTYSETIDITSHVQLQDETILTKDTTINPGLNTIPIRLEQDAEEERIYSIRFEYPDQTGNPLNKWAYRVVPPRELKKTQLHILVGKPSWDTSFALRTLIKQDDYELLIAIAKAKGGASFVNPPSPPDRVIIFNPTARGIASNVTNQLDDFISKGGIGFLFMGDMNASEIQQSPLRPFFPITLLSNEAATPSGMGVLEVTRSGSQQALLSFRDPIHVHDMWRDLPYFYHPRYGFKLKSRTQIFAEVGNRPVIIHQSYEMGSVVTVLVSGFWQLDFRNQAYRIESTYLSKWWDEVLHFGEETQVTDALYTIHPKIVQPNEEIILRVNPRKSPATAIEIHKLDEKLRSVPLVTNEETVFREARFSFSTPGNYKIMLANHYLCTIHVIYTPEENRLPLTLEDRDVLHDYLDNHGGGVFPKDLQLVGEDLKKWEEDVVETRTNPLFEFYPWLAYLFLVLLLLLLFLEWFLRRLFWR